MENTDSSYEPVDNQYMFGIMILIYQRKINIFFIKDQIKDYLIMEKNQLNINQRKKYHHDHTRTLYKTKV